MNIRGEVFSQLYFAQTKKRVEKLYYYVILFYVEEV